MSDAITGIHWQSTLDLYYLAIPLVLYLVIFGLHRRQNQIANQFFSPSRLKILLASVNFRNRKLRTIFYFTSLILTIVTLARPQWPGQMVELKSEGVELMFVLDISRSMLADDVKPNRLQQMKVDMMNLVEALPGHRYGVVVFAGSAALLSPVTTDPGAIRMYVESLNPNMLTDQGTQIADALKVASEGLAQGGIAENPLQKVVRIVILASDGEDHEPGAKTEVEKFKDKGVHVITVAYGTEVGGPIPEYDLSGFPKGKVRDQSGNEVITKVNFSALKEIADSGGGPFYRAQVGGDYFVKLREHIETYKKTQFASSTRTLYRELFQWFLGLAVFLFLAEMALGERLGTSLPKIASLGRSPSLQVTMLLMFNLIISSPVEVQAIEVGRVSTQDFVPIPVWENNLALKSLEAHNSEEAELYLLRALSQEPDHPVLHFNLGLVYLVQGRGELATRSFQMAEKIAKGNSQFLERLIFAAQFNQGFLAAEKGEVELALSKYQSALDLGLPPESVEVLSAKHNIELLVKRSAGKGKGSQKDKSPTDGDPDKGQGDKEQNKNKEFKPEEKKEFQSEKISPDEVTKILRELKQQEDRIRAQFNRGTKKEKTREKNW